MLGNILLVLAILLACVLICVFVAFIRGRLSRGGETTTCRFEEIPQPAGYLESVRACAAAGKHIFDD